MIFGLFRRRSERRLVDRLHGEIVAAVRQPVFYTDFAVPDTLEGRFEILVLHAALVVRRLDGLDAALAQALTDSMFRHLDIALREAGVSDIGVPKRMKKLASGYLGRAAAYASALGDKDGAALAAALARNVFGGACAASSREVQGLVRYVDALESKLSQAPASSFMAGQIPIPSTAEIAGARDDR